MKTLLVKYLPSGANSKTKKLLDIFLKELGGQTLEVIDLLKESIPHFTEASMAAYIKRNYMGEALSNEEKSLLKEQDRLVAQIKSADVFVMAFPMHNYSMPGLAKSYLDAVIFNGETFEYGKKAMKGKKCLTLFTSGGLYPQEYADSEYPNWDALTQTVKINCNFMGFDETEVLGTSLRDPKLFDKRLLEMEEKIKNLVTKWY